MTSFPTGAWVRDTGPLRNCNIVSDGYHPPHLEIRAGEIVRLLSHKLGDAYQIKFGDFTGVIFASESACYGCNAPSDAEHHELCPYQPDGALRAAEHEPGYAPERMPA